MPIERLLVAGAGLMGHGIAEALALAGKRATLYEPELGRAVAGRERVAAGLERRVQRAALTPEERVAILDRIVVSDDLPAAGADAEMAIEAVYEDVAVKTALWAELDRIVPQSSVFATNTSSISIDRLAEALSPDRRGRFIGMHFFSPVPRMPLVEMIRGSASTDETEARVRELASELGKQVIVSADRPGFIVNRMLMPFLGEAMRACEEGLGTAADIDTGARIGLNHPMGPLQLADFIGLDVCLHIMEVLHDGFGAPHMAPPPILRQMVDAGHLGQKTGRGFYTYPRS